MSKVKLLVTSTVTVVVLVASILAALTIYTVDSSVPVVDCILGIDAVATVNSRSIADIEKQLNLNMPFHADTRVTGKVVRILAGNWWGTGAVIGKRLIITVDHAIGQQEIVIIDVDDELVAGKVVGRIRAEPESLVLIQLFDSHPGFEDGHFQMTRAYPHPYIVVTQKGVFGWNPGVVVPGDSGSPVLNKYGEIIGLVSALNSGRHGVISKIDITDDRTRAEDSNDN